MSHTYVCGPLDSGFSQLASASIGWPSHLAHSEQSFQSADFISQVKKTIKQNKQKKLHREKFYGLFVLLIVLKGDDQLN